MPFLKQIALTDPCACHCALQQTKRQCASQERCRVCRNLYAKTCPLMGESEQSVLAVLLTALPACRVTNFAPLASACLSVCSSGCIVLAIVLIPLLSCRVTNPHEFEVDGVTFLGTSGQNIDDIYKYSAEENRLKLLQKVLEWGHLVPTAPDTLTCYPLSDSDPFILQSAPHVFFVGNQPGYSSHIVTG